MDNQSVGGVSAGNSVSVPNSAGFDSVDNSFENRTSEVHEVYPEPPMVNPQDKTFGKEDSDKIMDIPGTAHDKLAGLADMEDEEIDGNPEIIDEKEKISGIDSNNELSFEQKVILLQAEALNLLVKGINEKGKDKDKEELLKKLKALLEELGESDNSNKVSLTGAVLGVILLLLTTADKGTKQLEKEVKRAQ